jgi:hypothetical protein
MLGSSWTCSDDSFRLGFVTVKELHELLEELDKTVTFVSAALACLKSNRDAIARIVENDGIDKIQLSKGGWKQTPEARQRISEAKRKWHAENRVARELYSSQFALRPPAPDGKDRTKKPDSEE